MNFSFKKLLCIFTRTKPQPLASPEPKIKPINVVRANHLSIASIVSEEINSDEYQAAQEYFDRNKAS